MKIMTRIIENDLAPLFVGLYGVLIQITAFPAIYFFSNYFKTESVESIGTTMIFIWYLFPIIALLPLTLAIFQIRQRKLASRPFKKPMAGLIVNAVWILVNIVFIAIVFSI